MKVVSKSLRQLKQQFRSYIGPTIQSIAYHTRIMQLSYRLNHNGAIILMYHSVAEESFAKYIDPRDHVPLDVFKKQMAFLAQHRKVVGLDKLVTMLRQGQTPETGTIVITFDDGYLDNLSVAAPILDQYGLKANLFLPTGYIDRGETQWVDQVYTAFKFRTKRELLTLSKNAKEIFNLDDPMQYTTGYQAVCMNMLSATATKRRACLDDLLGQLQPSESPPQLTMTWNDVKTVLTNHQCFQVGGHTMEHTDMTSVCEDEARYELNCCARQIEDAIGIQPKHFSFPYGRTSGRLRQLVAEAGFESACGGDSDPVINSIIDPYMLPRVEAPASMRRFDLLTKTENTGIWRRLGR